MNKLREIITNLNVANSNDISQEKHQEIRGIIEELLPYAELEEEIGVDLMTLLKALKDGIYIKFDNGEIEHINGGRIGVIKYYGRHYFVINDLLFRSKLLIKSKKKDWALTEEELS